MGDELWLERLADATRAADDDRAPARLKSKVYSSVVAAMARSGKLLDLKVVGEAGGHLCVFERAVALLPVGEDLRSRNPCRVCHARALGERLEHAPIFWPGCPYSEFHNG
jgi:hypothetical protein